MDPFIDNRYDSVENIDDPSIYDIFDNLVLDADYQGFDTYLSAFQSFESSPEGSDVFYDGES